MNSDDLDDGCLLADRAVFYTMVIIALLFLSGAIAW